MTLCFKCHGSLSRGKPNLAARPPPLAICNNWAVLPLPEDILQKQPTWAEFSCCALAQVAMLYEVTGRDKKSLRSHALVFLSHCPAAMALPRHLSVSEYYVVFAKLTDSEIACETKTRLWIRKEVTKMLCSLYRQDIDTYFDIPEDLTFFAENEIEKLFLA